LTYNVAGYFTFAFVILCSSIGSIANEIYLLKKAEKNLKELIPPQGDVTVIRDTQVGSESNLIIRAKKYMHHMW
jgi:hypothetical protein